MENTRSVYVKSINETWEMADDMALKLEDFKKEHPEEEENTDSLYTDWFESLTAEDQAKVQRHKPQE